MRRFQISDSVWSCIVILLVASTLVPAIARLQRPWADAKCQANLRRWTGAVALYTEDFGRRYPTNRTEAQAPTVRVMLSDPTHIDRVTGQPVRFENGLSWVEALYTYLWDAAARTGRDWKPFRQCPNASTVTYPIHSAFACMTYVFNYNLIEYSPALVRNPGRTMLIREFDRLLNSELRPTIRSPDSSVPPATPFLTTFDQFAARTNANLHGNGSYIAFADGHVGYFTTDYFPLRQSITKTNCWDDATQQWWNWAPGSGKPANLIKAIAITP